MGRSPRPCSRSGKQDEAQVAALVAKGTPAIKLIYDDGDFHASFRTALANVTGVSDTKLGYVSRTEGISSGPRVVALNDTGKEAPEAPSTALAFASMKEVPVPQAETRAAVTTADGSGGGCRGDSRASQRLRSTRRCSAAWPTSSAPRPRSLWLRRSRWLLPLRPRLHRLQESPCRRSGLRLRHRSRSRTRTDPPDHHTCKSPPHRRAFCLRWPSWLLKRLFIGHHEKRRLVRRRPWDRTIGAFDHPNRASMASWEVRVGSPSRAGPFRSAFSP